MIRPVLTVVVPAYNVEIYLERCLDSVLYGIENHKDKIEVIVVNDGSSDNTIQIAQQYQNKFPKIVKVIDKKNGGHGSVLNVGVESAKGKYIKILDADDWVNIDDFGSYIDKLQAETADIVVTNYKVDRLYSEDTMEFKFENYHYDKQYEAEHMIDSIDAKDFFFNFSMPSMTISTDALQKVWQDGVLEKTFYTDQCFVAKVLLSAKNFVCYDLSIYRYFIGRPNQSVSAESLFTHRLDHEKVLRWLIEFTQNIKADQTLFKVLSKQITLMINTHYGIYINHKLTKAPIRELKQFDKFLKTIEFINLKEIENCKYLNFRLSHIGRTKLFRTILYLKGVNHD